MRRPGNVIRGVTSTVTWSTVLKSRMGRIPFTQGIEEEEEEVVEEGNYAGSTGSKV